jgi:NAD+ diphosphatase
MSSFDRSRRNTFAEYPIDRATLRRDQRDWLAAMHAQAVELLISEDLQIALVDDQLHLSACIEQPELFEQRWYLGSNQDRHYFMRSVSRDALPEHYWADLRLSALRLSPEQAGLAAYARGLQFWHARHRFCSNCGAATIIEQAGHRRRCVNAECASEHFPRTDPAIIVAVQFEGAILLGRQASWPANRYSTLAGFVEPGESLEDAVIREVFEESGVQVATCDYFSSQPWPFPASLMLGFRATAASADLAVGEELQDAQWFSLQAFESAICHGSLKLPPPVSVSFRLIEDWYNHHPQNVAGLALDDFLSCQAS